MTSDKALILALLVCSASINQIRSAHNTGQGGLSYWIPLKSDDGGKLFYLDQVEISVQNHSDTCRMLYDTCGRNSWFVTEEQTQGNLHDEEKYGSGLEVRGQRLAADVRLGEMKFKISYMGSMDEIGGTNFTFDGIISISDTLAYRTVSYKDHQYSDADWPFGEELTSLYLRPVNMTNTIGETKEADAVIVFGGVDRRLYKGEINYLRLLRSERSSIARLCFGSYLPMRSVEVIWPEEKVRYSFNRVDTQRIYRHGFSETNFDSSSVLFVGPEDALDWLHLQHLNVKKQGSYYLFPDCRLDDKPNLVFTVGSYFHEHERQQIVIEPEDYVIKMDDLFEGVQQGCVSAFRAVVRGPDDVESWSFGTRAMKKYYIVFDMSRERIGFADAA